MVRADHDDELPNQAPNLSARSFKSLAMISTGTFGVGELFPGPNSSGRETAAARKPAFVAPAVSSSCSAAETIMHSLGLRSNASADRTCYGAIRTVPLPARLPSVCGRGVRRLVSPDESVGGRG